MKNLFYEETVVKCTQFTIEVIRLLLDSLITPKTKTTQLKKTFFSFLMNMVEIFALLAQQPAILVLF